MIKCKILYLLFLLHINTINAQSFQNGDLDGVISGNSCLPAQWQNVPYNDVNCLAFTIGNDTPDLTSLTGPTPLVGMNGNPFSGVTFVSGFFGNSPPNFFQEGIMQTVSGFTAEKEYTIHFRQTVVKASNNIDKSGSWAVYIDTVLAGVSTPTHSDEPFNSVNLRWEARSVSFIAGSTSHLIKFLPMDDDSNYTPSQTDTLGALYMGIDSIGLEVITGVKEINGNNGFNLFPNPNNGTFSLLCPNNSNFSLSIYDNKGAKVYEQIAKSNQSVLNIDLGNSPKGLYNLVITTEKTIQNIKVAITNI